MRFAQSFQLTALSHSRQLIALGFGVGLVVVVDDVKAEVVVDRSLGIAVDVVSAVVVVIADEVDVVGLLVLVDVEDVEVVVDRSLFVDEVGLTVVVDVDVVEVEVVVDRSFGIAVDVVSAVVDVVVIAGEVEVVVDGF